MKKPGKYNRDDVKAEVFDSALPERLLTLAPSEGERHVPILRGARPELSPYIIKLTRPSDAPSIATPAEQLAQRLIVDDGEDDALPTSLRADLALNARELTDQLRDVDIVLDVPVLDASELPPLDGEADVPEFLDFPEILAASAQAIPEPLILAVHDAAPARGVVLREETIEEAPRPRASFSLRRIVVLPHGWQRALAAFMGLSFLLVMPLHAMQTLGDARGDVTEITEAGRAAIEDFSRGASALADARYTLAKDEFSRAAEKFADAESDIGDMHAAIAAVVNVIPQTDRTYESVKGLVTAGRELSTVAATMSEAADQIAPATSIDLVTKLSLLATAAESAAPHADIAAASLANVDPSIVPAEYAERVAELKAYAPTLATSLREFLTFSSALTTMLGGDGAMRYLVAFQNSTELRPTGGFVGSFAEMTVRNGAIDEMRVPGGGTYDTQGQLTEFVAAPSPIGLINARWELQDANWFPDFPSSARKMQWFYEHAGGPTTDGVLAINSAFVVNLLAIVGPIEMPEYGRTIDAENFMFETQKIVELEYDKTQNTPKAFIGDLAPLLLERITEADMPTFLAVLDLVGTSLAQKDIQIYFDDNGLESAIEELGWSGSLKKTEGDYLMVVNTNLGGGKTDMVIDQDVQVDVTIADDGSVVNTVTITKTHHGMPDALFSGRNNVDYLRLYVPEGSELLSADGFEIPADELFEESDVPLELDDDLALAMTNVRKDPNSGTAVWDEEGKTVFGNWMQTAPGETQVVRFTYKLPFTVAPESHGLIAAAKKQLGWGSVLPYSMLVQKQPGAALRTTAVTVNVPSSWQTVWTSHDGLADSGAIVDNATDAFFRLLVDRP